MDSVHVILKDHLEGPKSKATSCAACRKAKTRCRGATPDGPAYPCMRCVRLSLHCEDPQIETLEDPMSRMSELTKALIKRLESQPPVDRDRADRLLGLTALIYRRRVLTRSINPGGNISYGLEQLLKSLTAYLGMDGAAYIKELTRLDAPEGVMVDGQWFTHQSVRGASLHPYCAALFDESRSTIAVVSVRGEHRFLCNEAFARAFFSEQDANKWFLEEELPVPVIMSIPMHSSEKNRIVRTISEMMVDAPAPCTELRQIYKVRLTRVNVSVMAMVRMRFLLAERGEYMASAFSFSPLPMHAAPSKRVPQGARRSTLQVPADCDPWTEAAQMFGEWEEEAPTACLQQLNLQPPSPPAAPFQAQGLQSQRYPTPQQSRPPPAALSVNMQPVYHPRNASNQSGMPGMYVRGDAYTPTDGYNTVDGYRTSSSSVQSSPCSSTGTMLPRPLACAPGNASPAMHVTDGGSTSLGGPQQPPFFPPHISSSSSCSQGPAQPPLLQQKSSSSWTKHGGFFESWLMDCDDSDNSLLTDSPRNACANSPTQEQSQQQSHQQWQQPQQQNGTYCPERQVLLPADDLLLLTEILWEPPEAQGYGGMQQPPQHQAGHGQYFYDDGSTTANVVRRGGASLMASV